MTSLPDAGFDQTAISATAPYTNQKAKQYETGSLQIQTT
jgi:hypothetical protein